MRAALRSQVWEKDNGRCGICGLDIPQEEFQVDHIRSISAGGLTTIGNLQAAHKTCNQRKKERSPGWYTIPQAMVLLKTTRARLLTQASKAGIVFMQIRPGSTYFISESEFALLLNSSQERP